MDSDLQDISCSHDLLKNFLYQKGEGNENEAVKEYFKQINFPPVKDFSEGVYNKYICCFVSLI